MARIAGSRTLGEVRNSYTSKPAFNKAMRMDARDRLMETGVKYECKICGETRQVDICHIKPISNFNNETRIDIINAPDNNIVLCPLHHRLLDNNIIDLKTMHMDRINKGLHIIFGFNSLKEKDEKISIARQLIVKALQESKLFEEVAIFFDE